MSSGISIDESAAAPAPRVRPRVSDGGDQGFRPWHFFVLASILVATVAVIVARRSTPEHLILMSLTIAAAGAAAAAFYRTLAPLVAPLFLPRSGPVDDRTRDALEREKMLVLRSIKELEFDRAMGKLSQKDFDEMAGRLRARAVSLMKQLDRGSLGYTGAIEEELNARLASAPKEAADPATEGAINACPSCAVANDLDAVFCKKCGTRLVAS
ncbi:MAG TPA: zinc ribbon domain-containing protein [Vicinamibacterales bacterium]